MHMVCQAVDCGSRSVNGICSVSQHIGRMVLQVPSPEDAVFEDPLEHLVCMECAGVQDEDLILLCDGTTPLCYLSKMNFDPNLLRHRQRLFLSSVTACWVLLR